MLGEGGRLTVSNRCWGKSPLREKRGSVQAEWARVQALEQKRHSHVHAMNRLSASLALGFVETAIPAGASPSSPEWVSHDRRVGRIVVKTTKSQKRLVECRQNRRGLTTFTWHFLDLFRNWGKKV